LSTTQIIKTLIVIFTDQITGELYNKKAILIFGGCGGLGSVIVKTFKTAGYAVFTVDFKVCKDADHTIQLSGSETEMAEVVAALTAINIKFEVIVCVAGGFRMGNLQPDQLIADTQKMFSYNVKSAVSAAHIATKFLKSDGLLLLTGACAALSPTPDMIAYGVSKAATHHLVRSLAVDGSGLPKGTTVVAILPICLDTTTNREDMPYANFANWTPLETVASKVMLWAGGEDRPTNGSLIVIKTKQNRTRFLPVKATEYKFDEDE